MRMLTEGYRRCGKFSDFSKRTLPGASPSDVQDDIGLMMIAANEFKHIELPALIPPLSALIHSVTK